MAEIIQIDNGCQEKLEVTVDGDTICIKQYICNGVDHTIRIDRSDVGTVTELANILTERL